MIPTDKQLNEAAAIACGWQIKQTGRFWHIYHPDGKKNESFSSAKREDADYWFTSGKYAGAYCTDRNALPELWETLLSQREYTSFVMHLGDLLQSPSGFIIETFDLIMAAPRLQVIAFLKSIAQWPDGWEDK